MWGEWGGGPPSFPRDADLGRNADNDTLSIWAPKGGSTDDQSGNLVPNPNSRCLRLAHHTSWRRKRGAVHKEVCLAAGFGIDNP